ncbi:cytochrome p450 [Moniliophthora roreri MCA 2997]|uniref:Cytochrome p450 n=1 Tax=Moniliophthora roreri (strain MCA 2997) TaxID=1381753 RepID=V2XAD7_MONRO|nr:cytochrome p450 [Moniliophthora roreri MCA 2997]
MGLILYAALAGLAWAILRLSKVGRREPGLPPGPKMIPLLGNLHQFPPEYPHFKLTKWARQYGSVYSLKMGPGTAVVITDAAALKELMDKRSATTMDRPPNYIADAVAGGLNMALARYTENWRTLRRTAHAILTPQQSAKHLPIQRAEATQLLFDMLQTPESFYTHIRRYSNSVIMSVLYGKRCPRYETPETTAFFHAQHEWELLLEPGATPPLDLLPILKHVPERWTSWKKDVRACRQRQRDLYFGLLDETARRMEKGEENGCYMEEVLRRQEEFGMDREITGYLGGVLIEGGSDTTSSFLQSLILAMIAFPEAQRKAQAELDRVVGPHRMPTLDDIEDSPYIKAVIQETHRFRPVAPLMIPHATTAPEEYQGFLIPEGSTIFVNNWGIFHDPALFDEPEIYNPDRYILAENGTRPGVDGSNLRANLAFGCGRRICPGIHLAQNSININTMNLLWAFTFSHASDPKTGNVIEVDVNDYARGILTAPMPFKCTITPRSPERVEIIEREFHEATDTFSKFEYGLGKEDQDWVRRYRS